MAGFGTDAIHLGAATDPGSRENNEDRYVAIPPVFAVCDGQGGCAAPAAAVARPTELAQSATAVNVGALASAVETAERDIQGIEGSADRNRDMEQAFRGGVRHQRSRISWPATTLAGLALGDQGGRLDWIVFHVGQCRVYHWCSEGGLTRLTRDHSVVQELVDTGQIDADEASTHPQRHMVKKSLALRPRQHVAVRTEVEFAVRPAVAGERFLLCSDGVTAELTDAEIGSVNWRRGPTIRRLPIVSWHRRLAVGVRATRRRWSSASVMSVKVLKAHECCCGVGEYRCSCR